VLGLGSVFSVMNRVIIVPVMPTNRHVSQLSFMAAASARQRSFLLLKSCTGTAFPLLKCLRIHSNDQKGPFSDHKRIRLQDFAHKI